MAGVVRLVSSADRPVVVLGMPRSGTSVITRVINLLGLPVCREEDLYAAPGKPTGHWESTSLALFNDRLLGLHGGVPAAPVVPPEGWECSATAAELYEEAYSVFARAHPGSVWVWKDPRTCLTLPFWRRVLPGRPAAVFVHREPMEVVRSLHRRDGFGKAHCIAQWERYSRSALRAAAGMPFVTVCFGEMMADPVAAVGRLRSDLAGLGVPVRADPGQAAGFVAADRAVHRYLRIGLASDRDATDAQRFLLAVIDSLPPASVAFAPPDLGAESASTAELLSAIRERGTGRPGPRAIAREIWAAGIWPAGIWPAGIWPALRRSVSRRRPRRAP